MITVVTLSCIIVKVILAISFYNSIIHDQTIIFWFCKFIRFPNIQTQFQTLSTVESFLLWKFRMLTKNNEIYTLYYITLQFL